MHMLPVKQSAVILDFAMPILDKIDMSNKSLLERTLNIAIEVGIIVLLYTADKRILIHGVLPLDA